jgi:putative membrane protein
MFEIGFLSQKAPLFMDIVTIYFAILPILLFLAIRLAIKKRYKEHTKAQFSIFIISLIVILIFEIGVRVVGGFDVFLKESSVSNDYFITYLIIHIIIALVSVIGWVITMIKSYIAYKKDGFNSVYFKTHSKYSKLLFIGLTLTAYSGIGIYLMLFLM